jgi:adenylate cyclase
VGESPLGGWAYRDLAMLRNRALLARGHGDESTYEDLDDRYRQRAESFGFEGHIAIAKAM